MNDRIIYNLQSQRKDSSSTVGLVETYTNEKQEQDEYKDETSCDWDYVMSEIR